MIREIPHCVGLSEEEAMHRLSAAGHRVCIHRYEGYRTLEGADGFCVVRQRETTDAEDNPVIELIVCNFKRGITEI